MSYYVIWSIEHDAWWGPDRCGYTRNLADAGRYPRVEALAIVAEGNLAEFSECAIPVECVRTWVVRE